MSMLKIKYSNWIALILTLILATSMSPSASQGEVPDDLYNKGRQFLAQESYREAVAVFRELSSTFNESRYTADALYWEAFSLYRLGQLNELKEAVSALETQFGLFPGAKTHGDALELATRIRGELARRGDAEAAEKLTQQIMELEELQEHSADLERGGMRDEESETKLIALQALINMDSDRALPILRKIMQKRDENNETLRKEALFLIVQAKSDETEALLLDVIQNDPSLEVREQAVFWLSEAPGENSLNALIEILKNSGEPELQEEALFALSNREGDKPREVLENLALNQNASKDIREQAIFWLGRKGNKETPAFLMQLFSKLNDEDLKENVLFALSQTRDKDIGRWLFDVAIDESESLETRKQALFWAGQSNQVTLPELEKLYNSMDNTEMREQILFVLSQMDNEDSVAMLIEISKTEKDAELRKMAIFWLGQSKDPRVVDILEQIITE